MLKRILLLTCLLPLIGCVPTQTLPVDPEKLKADESLLGTWKTKRIHPMDEMVIDEITIEKLNMRERIAFPAGFLKLTSRKREPGKQPKVTAELYFCSTRVGDASYAFLALAPDAPGTNVLAKKGETELKKMREDVIRSFKDPNESKLFWATLRFSVDKNQLRIDGVGATKEKHEKEMEATWKKLKEELTMRRFVVGSYQKSHWLADTPANVRKYLQKHGKAHFTESVTFTKAKEE